MFAAIVSEKSTVSCKTIAIARRSVFFGMSIMSMPSIVILPESMS